MLTGVVNGLAWVVPRCRCAPERHHPAEHTRTLCAYARTHSAFYSRVYFASYLKCTIQESFIFNPTALGGI